MPAFFSSAVFTSSFYSSDETFSEAVVYSCSGTKPKHLQHHRYNFFYLPTCKHIFPLYHDPSFLFGNENKSGMLKMFLDKPQVGRIEDANSLFTCTCMPSEKLWLPLKILLQLCYKSLLWMIQQHSDLVCLRTLYWGDKVASWQHSATKSEFKHLHLHLNRNWVISFDWNRFIVTVEILVLIIIRTSLWLHGMLQDI